MKKKLINIVLGWWYWITNRNNKLAQERLSICVKCEFFLDQPFNDSMCLILNRVKFNDINEDPKKFSCTAWVKKEG